MNNDELLRDRQAIVSLLSAARIEKGMSQQALADLIGTKRSNICRMESGSQNITLDMLLKIADALGKDVSVLLREKASDDAGREVSVGRKILVLGCPGSGKSTFSVKLHEKTGIPLTHLDNIWWKPDRTHISRDMFDRELRSLMAGEEWILDGNYRRTYEMRIRACDTVIFLDIGEEECIAGIKERIGKERPDIPWEESEPDPELEAQVKKYREENRPVLLELFSKYPDRKLLVFRSRQEADDWLASLAPHPGSKSAEGKT